MKIKNVLWLVTLCVVSLLIFGMKSVFSWKPSDVSQNCMRTLYGSIHDVEHHTCDVVSMGNNFTVHYVEHAGSDCVNPNFPAIHIVADVEHTAWMQVVSTDSKYQRFIDAEGCAPFYNFEKDFYDSPLWAYGFFRRPTSFWKAHAYAVFINREEKTIECVGGVLWGFELSIWGTLPRCITPRPLTQQEWEYDWELLRTNAAGIQKFVDLVCSRPCK